MDDYEGLVRAARDRVRGTLPVPGPERDLGGDEVQLSVRVPAGLRAAAADVAARRGKTLAGFVSDVVRDAILADDDPFVGLAGDLVTRARAALGRAVADGTYQAATEQVDADDRARAGG